MGPVRCDFSGRQIGNALDPGWIRAATRGGICLIANLHSLALAGGWTAKEPRRFVMDNDLT